MVEYLSPIAPRLVWIGLAVHLVGAVVLALIVRGVRHRATGRFRTVFPVGLVVVVVGAVGLADIVDYRRTPTAYLLDDDTLTVRTRGRDLGFSLRAFDEVGLDPERYWRIAYNPWFFVQRQGRSVRGPFGIAAVTRPPGRQWVNVYVSDPDRVVVLEGKVNLIVSPDDPHAFVEQVRQLLRERSARPGDE